MAYTPEYEDGDISKAVIDFIVKGLVVVSSLATLIVLVLIYNFMKKRV